MGWFASFKGLRKLGVPPWIAGGLLLAAFLVTKHFVETERPSQTAAPQTAVSAA